MQCVQYGKRGTGNETGIALTYTRVYYIQRLVTDKNMLLYKLDCCTTYQANVSSTPSQTLCIFLVFFQIKTNKIIRIHLGSVSKTEYSYIFFLLSVCPPILSGPTITFKPICIIPDIPRCQFHSKPKTVQL